MITENIIFWGLIFHFIGDYLLQNDWMATNKTKENFPALIHAVVYSLPFIFICVDAEGKLSYSWLIILWSHFLIDRFRLATYWVKFINWNFKSKNFGFAEEKPAYMSAWLLIIVDNIIHILINTICIM